MIFDKEFETMSRKDIESLQLERLKKLVQYCDNNVKFYHDKFESMGVTADKIKVLSDINYLPVTTKEDIRVNYPYGMFAVPMKKVVRLHASSGTTGTPTVVGYTTNDLNIWSTVVARLVAAAGATDDDIVQICFGYGLFTGALGLHYGLEQLGSAVVPSSSGNTEKQIMLMKDFGTTALVSTPSYAMYMAEVAKDLGYTKDDFSLKLGLFGSEGCSEELRSEIENAWGLFATDNYGMSELIGPGVSGECKHRCGMHISEDHFLAEIVDSNTLEAKPEGELGELIVTTLTKECFPLIRYRTKDITKLNTQICECGRTTARMDKIRGRTDDMLKIRGVNVFPSQIESVILGLSEVSPNYQLVLRRKGHVDTLEVKVELMDNSLLEKYGELELLQQKISSKLQTVLGISSKVSLVEPRNIERFVGKAKRIVDLRNE